MPRARLFCFASVAVALLAVFFHDPTGHKDLPEGLRPFRPFFIKLINALGSGFALVGLQKIIIPLTPAALAEKACAEANLSNCSVGDAAEGLEKLTESLETDSKLTFLGRVVGQGMLVNSLRQRFLLQDNWAGPASDQSGTRGEEIDKQQLLPPIFILGLPRTGTTFLHNLLIRDPAFRGPLHWEVISAAPPPANRKEAEKDAARKAHLDEQLSQYKQLAPDVDRYHPLSALNPEECVAILSQTFMSLQFWMTMDVSGYIDWLRDQDQRPAIRWHRRVLKYFQIAEKEAEGGDEDYSLRRWVLKAPTWLGDLEPLLETYPDAMVVQVHRDARTSLTSASSLYTKLYGIMSDDVDMKRIGARNRKMWTDFAGEGIRVRRKYRDRDEGNGKDKDKPSRFVDVQFADLVKDPMAAVKKLYGQLNLDLSSQAESDMRAFLDVGFGTKKHGKHKYNPADFGFEEDFASQGVWKELSDIESYT